MYYDTAARNVGLMVGITGVLYMASLSRYTNLYVEWIGGEWVVWRETYRSSRSSSIYYKTILTSDSFDYVMKSVGNYIAKRRKRPNWNRGQDKGASG